jgi:ATP-dependent Clp protease ATP-binding subunit ClpC
LLRDEAAGGARQILDTLHVDIAAICNQISMIVVSGSPDCESTRGRLTRRSKQVVEYSIDEARSLDLQPVGTAHLFLGMLRDHDGVAGQVLAWKSVLLQDVRDQVRSLASPD